MRFKFPRKNEKETPPHTINERQMKRGYRAMGNINLRESESDGKYELSEYEEWLTKNNTE